MGPLYFLWPRLWNSSSGIQLFFFCKFLLNSPVWPCNHMGSGVSEWWSVRRGFPALICWSVTDILFFSRTCNIISHQSADVPVHSLLPFHAPNAHTWTYTGRASPAPAVEAVSGICEMPLLRTLGIPRRGWRRSEWWMKNGFEWTVGKEVIGVVSEGCEINHLQI